MKKRTTLTARGISQAGFLVLVGASMPNMLFETAFLSNESDEKFISSAAGQSKTAKALADAIARYARDYAKAVEK
jgi:N-acetylmuramoyl-L-alanine amidase